MPLAAAVAVGPGALGGQTFVASLLWPISQWLALPGRSPGVFLRETLVGDQNWGFLLSLGGDSYLNFGAVGVAVAAVVFGGVVKLLYVKFRRRALNSAVYALTLVYGLRIYFESIEKWKEAFALILLKLGETIFQIGEASERRVGVNS
jgi:hypothetical protein